jgi:hypothetical protein
VFLGLTQYPTTSALSVFVNPVGFSAGSSSEAGAQMLMPLGCTLQNFVVSGEAFNGAVNPHVFTLRANGAPTAISCTIPSGGSTCSSAETAVVATANLIDIEVAGSGAGLAVPVNVRYAVTCQ